VPRFGRTGTGVGVGDGVASTALAGRDSETTSAGIKKALEIILLNDGIHLKISRRLPIAWLAHRKKLKWRLIQLAELVERLFATGNH
jgi:hypothetical protein